MPPRSSRYRLWVCTVNNPTSLEHPSLVLESIIEDTSHNLSWAKGQFERGVESSTLHIQLVAKFKNPATLAACLLLYPRGRWASAIADAATNAVYVEDETGIGNSVPCFDPSRPANDADYSREFGFLPWQFEYGDRPKGQGKRMDLARVKAILDGGGSMLEVAHEEFAAYTRYYRGFESYKRMITPVRDFLTNLHVVWGPQGSGKTHMVRFETGDPDKTYWLSPPRCGSRDVWWPGYTGQPRVVIDEFEFGWISCAVMKRMIDQTPFDVQMKGSDHPFLATDVWIISNYPPETWWDCKLGAMYRRMMHMPLNTVRRVEVGPGGVNTQGVVTDYQVQGHL